jgi:hypothetical protein
MNVLNWQHSLASIPLCNITVLATNGQSDIPLLMRTVYQVRVLQCIAQQLCALQAVLHVF